MEEFVLNPGELKLSDFEMFLTSGNNLQIQLAKESLKNIEESRNCLLNNLESNKTIYGVNTGFGLLANTSIPSHQLNQLQKNLVLSHAVGVGKDLPLETVRIILLLKINSLACGFSAVRQEVIDYLIACLNADLLPQIPEQGSVGASGDLAPLAHCALMLIGEGQAYYKGKLINAVDGLSKLSLKPLTLEAKEGLALLNGTQVSTSIALTSLLRAQNIFKSALVIGAMTTLAANGNPACFDEKIHKVRKQIGQIKVSELFRKLLSDSKNTPSRVQDPYSIRCQPQVMGAIFDAIAHVSKIIERECNAVSDNPLIFSETNETLSGGNFHAEPIALVADYLAIALTEIGALSERRTAFLVDSNMSGLPAFLVKESGLQSGFMIAHVTAAALASENKAIAQPRSIDSLPTSANQEDHVSMATNAGLRLSSLLDNLEHVLSIECLAAGQAILLQEKLDLPNWAQGLADNIKHTVGLYQDDRVLANDFKKIRPWIQSGVIANCCDLEIVN